MRLALALRALRVLWAGLRCWSGDDAYERYLAQHRGHQHALLSRRDFYRDYFDRRAKRPRCC
ncbi:MAG: putative selenoprotein [Planctomycetes bacterium]|nr:putative selenoprotein [Planctomycetota bacterium]